MLRMPAVFRFARGCNSLHASHLLGLLDKVQPFAFHNLLLPIGEGDAALILTEIQLQPAPT